MSRKNDPNNTQPGGGSSAPPTSTTTVTNTATTSGIVIVQQQTISEQQHFILPAANNSVPMIITTPLGRIISFDDFRSFSRSCIFRVAVPSMIHQQLPTIINAQQQQQTMTAATNTPSALVASPSGTGAAMTVTNSSVPNKTTKSPGQDRLVCSLCNKVYRSSAGLRYHKRKRHRGTQRKRHGDHLRWVICAFCSCS